MSIDSRRVILVSEEMSINFVWSSIISHFGKVFTSQSSPTKYNYPQLEFSIEAYLKPIFSIKKWWMRNYISSIWKCWKFKWQGFRRRKMDIKMGESWWSPIIMLFLTIFVCFFFEITSHFFNPKKMWSIGLIGHHGTQFIFNLLP